MEGLGPKLPAGGLPENVSTSQAQTPNGVDPKVSGVAIKSFDDVAEAFGEEVKSMPAEIKTKHEVKQVNVELTKFTGSGFNALVAQMGEDVGGTIFDEDLTESKVAEQPSMPAAAEKAPVKEQAPVQSSQVETTQTAEKTKEPRGLKKLVSAIMNFVKGIISKPPQQEVVKPEITITRNQGAEKTHATNTKTMEHLNLMTDLAKQFKPIQEAVSKNISTISNEFSFGEIKKDPLLQDCFKLYAVKNYNSDEFNLLNDISDIKNKLESGAPLKEIKEDCKKLYNDRIKVGSDHEANIPAGVRNKVDNLMKKLEAATDDKEIKEIIHKIIDPVYSERQSNERAQVKAGAPRSLETFVSDQFPHIKKAEIFVSGSKCDALKDINPDTRDKLCCKVETHDKLESCISFFSESKFYECSADQFKSHLAEVKKMFHSPGGEDVNAIFDAQAKVVQQKHNEYQQELKNQVTLQKANGIMNIVP